MYGFFKEPTRVGLREILQDDVGELGLLDFKEEWIPYDRIAKNVLAFGNRGGGCLIFGVHENDDGTLESVGLEKLREKSEATKGIDKYIPPKVNYEIINFSYNASEYEGIIGLKFQALIVECDPRYIPLISIKGGSDIEKGRIYTRNGTETTEASYEQLQKMISMRVETNFSSTSEFELDTHLSQLKTLYNEIERYRYVLGTGILTGLAAVGKAVSSVMIGSEIRNPNFPEEDYEQFAYRMIDLKKKSIEKLLINGSYEKNGP